MTTMHKLPPHNFRLCLKESNAVSRDVRDMLVVLFNRICMEHDTSEPAKRWVEKRRALYAKRHPAWQPLRVESGALVDFVSWHQKRTTEQILRSLRLAGSLGTLPFSGAKPIWNGSHRAQ